MHNSQVYVNLYPQNKSIRTDLILLFGIGLAVASTAALVLTLQSLVTGIEAKVIACLAGIALEGCLFLFASHHNYRVRLFSGVLLVLSVAMTTLFIENTWQTQQTEHVEQQHVRIQQSVQSQQIQYEIQELNTQIAGLLATAQTDSEAGYRDRSLSTQQTIQQLQDKRSALQNQLIAVPDVAPTQTHVLNQYPLLRLVLFSLIALVIDLGAMIALSQPRPVTMNTTTSNQQDRPTPKKFVPELVPVDPDYQKVVQAITTGDVPPSKNQVRKQLNIGATKVADYFSRMMDDGIVRQDDKGWYQLAV